MTFGDVTLRLLEACKYTLGIFGITLVFAIPLGLIFCFLSKSRFRIVRFIMRVFIWIIRGTPLMLQIMVVFYAPGIIFNAPMRDRFLAVCIAFVINYAAYFSEIFRGGIESIPKGQYEACTVLGFKKSQTFFKVIFPQVIKRIIPPMSNEIITLVKDTSLASIIGISEIIISAKEVVSMYAIIYPLFYTAVFYLVFVGILTIVFRIIEKKLDYYRS